MGHECLGGRDNTIDGLKEGRDSRGAESSSSRPPPWPSGGPLPGSALPAHDAHQARSAAATIHPRDAPALAAPSLLGTWRLWANCELFPVDPIEGDRGEGRPPVKGLLKGPGLQYTSQGASMAHPLPVHRSPHRCSCPFHPLYAPLVEDMPLALLLDTQMTTSSR